ncbi:MAG: hypothetical protein J6X55_09540, partial [Victivallales bacterium]|nr:hypothetical protein [Victivallales bacterium]
MKEMDLKVPTPRRHRKESPRRLLVNSMIVSVVVSLVIHALILLLLGHIRFVPMFVSEKKQNTTVAEETDWIFDIPLDPRDQEANAKNGGHTRQPWQIQKPVEKLPVETVKPQMAVEETQLPDNPLVAEKDFNVSQEDLDSAFKSIKLTGVEVEQKKIDEPLIESITLPKMADMVPDTSVLLDIPDVPDAVIPKPDVKVNMSGIQHEGISEEGSGAVKPVALPAETE